MLGHKTSLNKYQMSEIIRNSHSEHRIKIEINNKKITRKLPCLEMKT